MSQTKKTPSQDGLLRAVHSEAWTCSQASPRSPVPGDSAHQRAFLRRPQCGLLVAAVTLRKSEILSQRRWTTAVVCRKGVANNFLRVPLGTSVESVSGAVTRPRALTWDARIGVTVPNSGGELTSLIQLPGRSYYDSAFSDSPTEDGIIRSPRTPCCLEARHLP